MDILNVPVQKFPVSADGTLGISGDRRYDTKGPCHGQDGQHAKPAGYGGPGGEISVLISASQNSLGGIHVKGIKTWESRQFEVPHGQNLFLNAAGGNGGEGGIGEGGQQGTTGANGADATKDHSGGNGDPGEAGGNGGYGSNGGNGGNGGVIEVTLREEDMNLLIAVECNVSGGKGGPRGRHGIGGAGGPGGNGGAGHSWTETIQHTGYSNATHKTTQDRTEHVQHSNSGGCSGPNGPSGSTPSTILQDGQPGLIGSFSFVILNQNGTTSRYPSCYDLRVVEGVVEDENFDAIFEPGEHAILQKLKIKNVGGMPSPTFSKIPLKVLNGHWLDPDVEQEGAWLPTTIPPGVSTEVLGIYKTFILQEPSTRIKPWDPLIGHDVFKVLAVMPGLDRVLPRFILEQPLTIQYPLVLTPPAYVPTVSLGDDFTVQWKIRNISSKAYGQNTPLSRLCGTRLASDENLDDKYHASHEKFDLIEIVEAGGEQIYHTVFHVSDRAEAFARGHFYLELLLDEPSNDTKRFSQVPSPKEGTRLISQVDVGVQISSCYQFDPKASYLLVVNTDTSGSLVKEVKKYIEESLHLNVDIFNICVGGSLTEESTNTNVLIRYTGKSVIFACNPFDYFGTPDQSILEFVDPWILTALLRNGTNVLLLGAPEKLDEMWYKRVCAPEYRIDYTGNDGSLHDLDMKLFEQELCRGPFTSFPHADLRTHTLPVSVGWFRSRKGATNHAGNKLARRLSKRFPLRRFALATDYSESRDVDSPPKVIVREGLSLEMEMLATDVPCNRGATSLPEVYKYLIVAVLPYEQRASMFWAPGRPLSPPTTSGEKFKDGEQPQPTSSKKVSPIDFEDVRHYISLSMRYDLVREVSTFCHKAPWQDRAKKDLENQLPILNRTFNALSSASSVIPAEIIDVSPIVSTIAWLMAATKPTLFGKAYGRKRAVQQYLRTIYTSTFPPGIAAEISTKAKELSPQMRKDIMASQKGKPIQAPAAIIATLSAIAQALHCGDRMHFTGVPFYDIVTEMVSTNETFLWSEGLHVGALAEYATFEQRMKDDEGRSRRILGEMVVHDDHGKGENQRIDSAMFSELGMNGEPSSPVYSTAPGLPVFAKGFDEKIFVKG